MSLVLQFKVKGEDASLKSWQNILLPFSEGGPEFLAEFYLSRFLLGLIDSF